MTAFASRTGSSGTDVWSWEMRGVNARGLDLRLKLPEGIEGLEVAVRGALAARLGRGNVSLTLRLDRDEGAGALELDAAQLDRVLRALAEVRAQAKAMGMPLAPPSAGEVLSQRGVFGPAARGPAQDSGIVKTLLDDLDLLLDDFVAMRRAEGKALHAIILDQLKQVDLASQAAAAAVEAHRPAARMALRTAMQRVMDDVIDIEEGRVAQELALMSVKFDVTEEIDRLQAHVVAARQLLEDPKPAGRRLDFLAQEFNREANTLCSKAQSEALTRIGLDLKATIDQMREQIQNVE